MLCFSWTCYTQSIFWKKSWYSFRLSSQAPTETTLTACRAAWMIYKNRKQQNQILTGKVTAASSAVFSVYFVTFSDVAELPTFLCTTQTSHRSGIKSVFSPGMEFIGHMWAVVVKSIRSVVLHLKSNPTKPYISLKFWSEMWIILDARPLVRLQVILLHLSPLLLTEIGTTGDFTTDHVASSPATVQHKTVGTGRIYLASDDIL